MFDKEEQRRRAEAFAQDQLARGAKPVSLPPIQITQPAPVAVRGHGARPGLQASILAAKKAAKKPKYDQVPFENSIGQRIEPGTRVIAVAQGYSHAIRVREAVYLGLHRSPNGKVSSVVVEAEATVGGYFLPDGTKANWNTPNAKYKTYMARRKSALPAKRIYAIK